MQETSKGAHTLCIVPLKRVRWLPWTALRQVGQLASLAAWPVLWSGFVSWREPGRDLVLLRAAAQAHLCSAELLVSCSSRMASLAFTRVASLPTFSWGGFHFEVFYKEAWWNCSNQYSNFNQRDYICAVSSTSEIMSQFVSSAVLLSWGLLLMLKVCPVTGQDLGLHDWTTVARCRALCFNTVCTALVYLFAY